ncbi:hypothetical protein INT47_005293 [Mucor saturninus]|uniref:Uncharacterized protein n=1 Tax=Mucor saturninus TaxID=64648 RepID=A0A8H7R8P9_9FUNG|nr:hypothetical protein INT47_005293 [Mucor saturninus]
MALSWNKELSQFLKDIGLVETSECLESELIVLSRHHLQKLPQALDTLVENLLVSLERHVNAKEQLLESNDKTHADLLVTKRKRPDDDNDEEEEERERAKRLDPEQIQIRATTEEVNQRINTFIQAKQNELDESNRTEFLSRHDPKADDVTCARTDAREINRNIQMKFDIVNNEDGPLARSLLSYNDANKQQDLSKSTSNTCADPSERISNIEQHLNIRLDEGAKPPFSTFERIKILENTLMDIERQHPRWAAVHFNQPNRQFPPPPPVKYITRPPSSVEEEVIPIQETYISTPMVTTAPQGRLKTQGRANSSLTRAVIDQLNQQVSVVDPPSI